MAKVTPENIVFGKSYSFSYTADKNNPTLKYTENIKAFNGKTITTLTFNTSADASHLNSPGFTDLQDNDVQTGGLKSATDLLKKNTTINIFNDIDSYSTSVYKDTTVTEKNGIKTTTTNSFLNSTEYEKTNIDANKKGVHIRNEEGVSGSVYEFNRRVESDNVALEVDIKLLSGDVSTYNGFNANPHSINYEAGLDTSLTLAEISATAEAGDDALGISTTPTVKVGEVSLDIGPKFGYGKNEKTGLYELDFYTKADANFSAIEASQDVTASIAGVDVSGRVSTYLGGGVVFEAGIKGNEFVFDLGAAVGLGFRLKFNIKLNDLGIDYLNGDYEYISPGNAYAEENTEIVVNAVRMRMLSDRIDSVNGILNWLSDDIYRALQEVAPNDAMDFFWKHHFGGKNYNLEKASNYLIHTAERFENVERIAYSRIKG
jgi:hypothetical protein